MKKILTILVIAIFIILGYIFVTQEDNIIEVEEEIEEVLVKDNEKIEIIDSSDNLIENLISNEEIKYLPMSKLSSVNIDFQHDKKNNRFVMSNREHRVVFELKKEEIFIDDKREPLSEEIKFIEDEIIVDYDLLNTYYNVKAYYNESKNKILIENYYKNKKQGEILTESNLYGDYIKDSMIIGEFKEGKIFNVIEVDDNWVYVYDDDINYGYVNRKNISILEKEENKKEDKKEPIIMTWDQIYNNNPSTENIKEMPGLDIISPTWVKLKNDKGEIRSLINEDYISWTKDRNYDIWLLASNQFGDIEMTSSFLRNSISRENFIKKLLILCQEYDFQGINMDFENIYKKDKLYYNQFISELSYYLSKEDIILSADVTVIGGSDNWSKCYDRERLAALVDYLVIMTYDEHWASSPVSGSVSSYDWVKSSIKRIINERDVDPSKIIMGIPLYTRIWYETPSTSEINKMDVRSKSINLRGQDNILEKINFKPIWDSVDKQYYMAYIEDNKVKKIWLEEKRSIRYKASIVKELGLAGAAMWSRGLENDGIWEVIDEEINGK